MMAGCFVKISVCTRLLSVYLPCSRCCLQQHWHHLSRVEYGSRIASCENGLTHCLWHYKIKFKLHFFRIISHANQLQTLIEVASITIKVGMLITYFNVKCYRKFKKNYATISKLRVNWMKELLIIVKDAESNFRICYGNIIWKLIITNIWMTSKVFFYRYKIVEFLLFMFF